LLLESCPDPGLLLLGAWPGPPAAASLLLGAWPGPPGVGSLILEMEQGCHRFDVRISQLGRRCPEQSPPTCRSARRSPRGWPQSAGQTQPPALALLPGRRTPAAAQAAGLPGTWSREMACEQSGFKPSPIFPPFLPLAHRANSTTRLPPGATQAPSSGLRRWTILQRGKGRV
jgi:hypothetical protein